MNKRLQRSVPVLAAALATGCGGGPEAPALTACAAVPGLSIDPAGRALLEPVVISEELELWAKSEPTQGSQALGPDKVAELRSQTRCAVDSVELAGTGQWVVKLTRTQPEVRTDGSFGDPVSQVLEWRAHKRPEGVRVETGLSKALNMRKNAGEARAKGDLKQYASLWGTIDKRYGDPLVAWEVEEAQRLGAEHHLLKSRVVTARFDRVEQNDDPEKPNQAVVVVKNAAKRPLARVDVAFAFQVEGQEQKQTVATGAVEPSSELEVRADIPLTAEGNVVVTVEAVHLP